MVYTELALRWQQFHVASAMPALRWIFKKRAIKSQSLRHVGSHASAVSLLKRAENTARYISDHQSISQQGAGIAQWLERRTRD